MSDPLRILIVEDSAEDAELMIRGLQRSGLQVEHERVWDPGSFRAQLAGRSWDVVLSDYSLPGFGGLAALQEIRSRGIDVPFIIVTGTIDEETAVECLKQGADDYILKENLVRLGPAVENAIGVYEERRQRERLEARVRQAQKMEAVGRLAAGVAHDIGNLVGVILRGVSALEPTVSREPEAREALAAIQEAANEGRTITDALMAVCHGQPVARGPVELCALIDETTNMLSRVLPASVDVRIEHDRDRRVWVHADGTQLRQVLLNLAINARDAMPDGGTLRLTATLDAPNGFEPEDGPESAGGEAYLIVEDDGAGMPEEVRQRAFEPFFTTKPRAGGSGFGLSVVHGFVSEHGGRIDLRSRPGEGTRVVIALPLTVEPVVSVPAASAPAPQGSSTAQATPEPSGHIIIAEENAHSRAVMLAALRDFGHEVVEAGDGAEVLLALHRRRESTRLVIIDASLIDVGHRSYRQEILGMCPSVSVLLTTSDAAFEPDPPLDRRERVLAKPFTVPQLRETALGLLRQHPAAGSEHRG